MRGNQASNSIRRLAIQITHSKPQQRHTASHTRSGGINILEQPRNVISRRTLSTELRQRRTLQSVRTALSVEGSSLRYVNMINNIESNIIIGPAQEIDEDEDGT